MTTNPSQFRRWINLFNTLKYGLVFAALIVFLPLTALPFMPLHSLFGGLFMELGALQVFSSTLALAIATWSLMFTQGLIVDGVEARYEKKGAAYGTSQHAESTMLPAAAERFFGVPVTTAQILAYLALASPGLLVLVATSSAHLLQAAAGAGAGIALAYVLLSVASLPVHRSDRADRVAFVVPGPVTRLLGRRMDGQPGRIALSMRRAVSSFVQRWPLRALFRHVMVDDPQDAARPPVLVTGHYFAVWMTLFFGAVVVAVGWLLDPITTTVDVAVQVFLWTLLSLLVWTIGAIDFHFARYRLSPFLLLVLWMVLGYALSEADHHFEVRASTLASQHDADDELRLDALVQPGDSNLVVVAVTGGGIQAAAWVTKTLERMHSERPVLSREVRLLSTVSGGSTGAAFFLSELYRRYEGLDDDKECRDVDHSDAALTAFSRATKSSLVATAYGFTFPDFGRIAAGPLTSFALVSDFFEQDRGKYLEARWARTDDYASLDQSPWMSDLRPLINRGCLPAPVFNTTVMETGRRVMITPIALDTAPDVASLRQAHTLSWYLGRDTAEVDVRLFTGARLSATFPYVAPAARASFANTVLSTRDASDQHLYLDHHFIDGGYHDNFGISSTIDLLDALLRTQNATSSVRRVLVVQVRAFADDTPDRVAGQHGAATALIGPLVGLINIRNGVATSRNEAELARFMDAWEVRSGGTVQLETIVLQPAEGDEGPLSWHLTDSQTKHVDSMWVNNDSNDRCLIAMNAFLDRGTPIHAACKLIGTLPHP